LKILAVLPTFRPENYTGKVGGGEISNRILLQSLAERGHSVTVCAISSRNHPQSKVVVHASEGRHCGKILNKILGLVKYRALIRREVRKVKPDVILCGTKGVEAAVKEGKKLRVPVGIFIRAFENLNDCKSQGSIFNKLKAALEGLVYGDYGPDVVEKLDFLLPNSRFMEKCILERFPNKRTKVVCPPIMEAEIQPLKISKNIKSVYMVGASEHKGAHIFSALADRFPDVIFGVIGDASIPPGEVKIEGNIKRYGWTDVVKLLSDEADLFVVPSVCEEAFGRVAIEGLIAGCTLLASNIGGLPETVNFESELLVPPDDEREWVARIADVIEKPDILHTAVRRAQSNVPKYFRENQVNELESFLLSYV